MTMPFVAIPMLCAILVGALGAPRGASAPAAVSQPVASALPRWLAGCWQQRVGDTVTDEQWMSPSGGAMIGMSRTVTDKRMRAWEALRVIGDSGRVVYIAQPNGGRATRFTGSAVTDTVAVFENPQHDFPQRIAYRRVHADSLLVRISAVRDGAERGMDMAFRRVPCSS